ncbi:MAG: N-acetyltransferase family protein [Acidobacteria bacterium]|nr:MAG: N-acetyltransferase family protein [Acidobacteriota bacterium]
MRVKFRIAQPTDLPSIVEIYNQAVALKRATAELTPVSAESKREWLAGHTPGNYPVFVAEKGNVVVGWCSLSPYRRGRMALRYTAEISYYIHQDFRRMGIGSQLVALAMEQSRTRGIKTLIAILLDVNLGSIRLLEKLGFRKWGELPGVADFDGNECGHLYYGFRVQS